MRSIICFLITLSSFNLSADQTPKYGLPDIEIITGGIFCNDQSTLSYIDKDYDACVAYINFISKFCVAKYNKAMPEFESVDEYLKHDVLVHNLTELYVICVKAKIYEDVENVVFLKNLGIKEKRERP